MKLEPHNEIVAKPQPLWVNQDMIIPLHCTFSKFISELTPKLQEAFKPSLLVSGAVLWRMCLTKGWSRLCTVNPIATGKSLLSCCLLWMSQLPKKKKNNQSGNNNSIVSVIEISLLILILMYPDTSSEGTKQKNSHTSKPKAPLDP